MSAIRLATIALLAAAAPAFAKLPPLTDDAKAKAAEAKAKSDWGDKVAAYKLCQAQDRAVARYLADAKKAGRDAKPGSTPPGGCNDPGPFAASTPQPPLEAAGAHSPAATAAKPHNSPQPQAQKDGKTKQ